MTAVNSERLRAVWENELERLELDVIAVERLLRGLHSAPLDPWKPVAALDSMPADLAVRARQLLARQQLAAQDLASALESARNQITFTARVIHITGRMQPGPVYFDREA
ncbi:MAG: hypothetical protein JWQ32_1655 [Marmoricola sp.]|nr:hypothetical protein [Marmoricola sp.]